MRFNKAKCEVLDLEQSNPKQENWLGSDCSVALLKMTWGSQGTAS